MTTCLDLPLLLSLLADPVDYTLRPAGLAMMVSSIISVLLLTAFCMYKVLTLPPVEVEDLHAPPAIDTGDTIDAD